MTPEDFIDSYESALKSQNWDNIRPLMSDQVCVTFSSGKVHRGMEQVCHAFQNNFDKIKNEDYRMSEVDWLIKEKTYAVFLFEFHWTGLVKGQLISGNGIGTSVIVNEGQGWQLLTEHLGKQSN